MADFLLMDTLAELINRTVKERLMHTKGVGAYGTFRPYMSMSDYTKAAFLADSEVATSVFVRFSKMFGKSGSPDTSRTPKGFSVKFFTDEGNYDLICQNMPIGFMNDERKLPDLLKAFSPRKDTDLADNESFWQFFAENPEAVNMVTWLFSDRGTTKSYRHMESYSVNTYRWISETGAEYLVRYKWNPTAGVKEIARGEAEFLAGFDPDVATRELVEAIAEGQYPEYELAVQLVSQQNESDYDFDLESCVIHWPEEKIPYVKIGKLVLDRLPEKFYEEVEKAAFTPSNLIPGIEFSSDTLLAVMSFINNSEARERGAWL